MPSYVVESYAADSGAVFDDARERARRTEELGDGVRYVRTTFLPDDQTILHFFEAPSAEELDRAGKLAVLAYERIVVAVESPPLVEERESTLMIKRTAPRSGWPSSQERSRQSSEPPVRRRTVLRRSPQPWSTSRNPAREHPIGSDCSSR